MIIDPNIYTPDDVTAGSDPRWADVPYEQKAIRQKVKEQAFINNLPSWVKVSTAVDNIANLADAKIYLKKLSRVVYWLARDSEK